MAAIVDVERMEGPGILVFGPAGEHSYSDYHVFALGIRAYITHPWPVVSHIARRTFVESLEIPLTTLVVCRGT
jgi:hypothetical protein